MIASMVLGALLEGSVSYAGIRGIPINGGSPHPQSSIASVQLNFGNLNRNDLVGAMRGHWKAASLGAGIDDPTAFAARLWANMPSAQGHRGNIFALQMLIGMLTCQSPYTPVKNHLMATPARNGSDEELLSSLDVLETDTDRRREVNTVLKPLRDTVMRITRMGRAPSKQVLDALFAGDGVKSAAEKEVAPIAVPIAQDPVLSRDVLSIRYFGQDGTQRRKIDVKPENDVHARRLAVNYHGDYFFLVRDDRKVEIRTLHTGKLKYVLDDNNVDPLIGHIHNTPRILVASGKDRVEIRNIRDGLLLFTEEVAGTITALVANKYTAYFATRNENGQGNVILARSLTEESHLHGFKYADTENPIQAMALSRDQQRLIVVLDDKILTLDAAKGKVLTRASYPSYHSITSKTLSVDGEQLLIAADDVVHFLDTATGVEIRRLHGEPGWAASVAMSQNRRYLYTANQSGRSIDEWEMPNGDRNRLRMRIAEMYAKMETRLRDIGYTRPLSGPKSRPNFRDFDHIRAQFKGTRQEGVVLLLRGKLAELLVFEDFMGRESEEELLELNRPITFRGRSGEIDGQTIRDIIEVTSGKFEPRKVVQFRFLAELAQSLGKTLIMYCDLAIAGQTVFIEQFREIAADKNVPLQLRPIPWN